MPMNWTDRPLHFLGSTALTQINKVHTGLLTKHILYKHLELDRLQVIQQ